MESPPADKIETVAEPSAHVLNYVGQDQFIEDITVRFTATGLVVETFRLVKKFGLIWLILLLTRLFVLSITILIGVGERNWLPFIFFFALFFGPYLAISPFRRGRRTITADADKVLIVTRWPEWKWSRWESISLHDKMKFKAVYDLDLHLRYGILCRVLLVGIGHGRRRVIIFPAMNKIDAKRIVAILNQALTEQRQQALNQPAQERA